jgi:hypothetical protein
MDCCTVCGGPFCWAKDCLECGVIGATGVEVVGVGGSSPLVAAGVVPAFAPFLFAGFWNQYQRCSSVEEARNFTLTLSLVPFFLGLGLFADEGVGGAWFDTDGDGSGRGGSLAGAGGGGIWRCWGLLPILPMGCPGIMPGCCGPARHAPFGCICPLRTASICWGVICCPLNPAPGCELGGLIIGL